MRTPSRSIKRASLLASVWLFVAIGAVVAAPTTPDPSTRLATMSWRPAANYRRTPRMVPRHCPRSVRDCPYYLECL